MVRDIDNLLIYDIAIMGWCVRFVFVDAWDSGYNLVHIKLMGQ